MDIAEYPRGHIGLGTLIAAMNKLVTTDWVADFLGLPKGRVYELARIPGYFPPGVCLKFGRNIRWSPDKLIEFINAGGPTSRVSEEESK